MTDRVFEPPGRRLFAAEYPPQAPIAPDAPPSPAENLPASADDPFGRRLAAAAGNDNAEDDPNDPFAKRLKGIGLGTGTSATGAFARGALRGALPALGSLPAVGAGAEAGGIFGGAVFGPPGAFVGAIGGGIAGGFLGAEAVASAQNWVLSKLPESWVDKLGMSERQAQLDQQHHGTASFLGGLAPYAVAMRPGIAPKVALPENATALQRVLSHPATSHVFGGGIMGGMELGQEAASGQPVDWSHVAISTAFGVVFNRPTRIGESLTGAGSKPVRRLFGIPEPVEKVPQPATEKAPEGPIAAPAPTETPESAPAEPAPQVTAADWRKEITERTRTGRPFELPPTVADAADLKIMGPGITEEVFKGSHAQAPEAEAASRDGKRLEDSVIGVPPAPDLHAVARRMHVDLFDRYDELQRQRADTEAWVEAHPEDATARQHLADLEAEKRKLQPEVQAAYRRGAEAVGGEIAPPAVEDQNVRSETPAEGAGAVAPAAAPSAATSAQRAVIKDEITKRLVAAGRPKEEAEAAADLWRVYFEAKARRFEGKKGSAQDIFEREMPDILKAGEKPSEHIPKPRRVDEEKLSLVQWLAHRGGIAETADLRAIFGRNPFVPGFGKLFRKGGMTADRAREAASEAGYLVNNVERTGQQATARELLDALNEESRGRKVYRGGEQRGPTAEERLGTERPEEPEALEPHELEARENFHSETMSEDDWKALEEARLYQKKRDLIREREAQGQMGLPGTERITQGELAQRRANEPLRPSVEQKPMDIGLFGDAKEQGELFQRGPAPIFYSAVARAVESAKQEKAPASQWLGMLKNVPGVKAEEMEWLGLEDWLKSQKGSVTKQEIADYVRANQIEVKEVEKGASEEQPRWRVWDSGGPWPDTFASRDDAVAARWESAREFAEREWRVKKPRYEGDEWKLVNTEDDELTKYFDNEEQAREAYEEAVDHSAQQWRQEISIGESDEGGGSNTKFSQYTLPGGENYRELLLTLAERENPRIAELQDKARSGTMTDAEEAEAQSLLQNKRADVYRSSHFDEPNILAHVRFNERTIDGKRTLFVEEVQSDWMQKGKREGFRPSEAEYQAKQAAFKKQLEDITREISTEPFPSPERHRELHRMEAEITDQYNALHDAHDRGVPSAPFKTTWPELSMKRIIRYAAENGYEKVAWTSGETQAARYDLSKQISAIHLQEDSPGNRSTLTAFDHQGKSVINQKVTPEELPDIIGKEAAEKLLAQEPEDKFHTDQYPRRRVPTRTLEGLDLKVGGEGMKGFYDQILPATVNKLTKKFGGKVERGELPEGDKGEIYAREGGAFLGNARSRADVEAARAEGKFVKPDQPATPIHTLDINDKLRDAAVEQGFPLFQTVKGSLQRRPDMRSILRLTKEADASTFLHETGHEWLHRLILDAADKEAPESLRQDAATVRQWLGAKPEAGAWEITRSQHEKFARGFETYLMEGRAPSKGLAAVFARFKAWLTQIYKTLTALRAPINDDIRAVFDRMIAEEPQSTVIAPDLEPAKSLADIHRADARELHPREGDAASARVVEETNRAYAEAPEHQREIEDALAKFYAEHEPDLGGEAGGGAGAGGEVHPGGIPAGTEPGGGVAGAQPEAELAGGAGPAGQAHGVAREPRAEGGGGGERAALGDAPLAPHPAGEFTRTDSLAVGKDGNIRVENLTSVPEFMAAIEESARQHPGGGPITMGDMMALADDFAIDPNKIDAARLTSLFGGVANLSSKIWALRKAVAQSAEIVHGAMLKVRDGGSEADVAEFARVVARHDMMQSVLSSVTTEAGRGLGMGFRNLENWQKAENLAEFLKANTGRTLFQLKQMAKLGAQLDSPAKVTRFLRDAQKRSFGGMILEYWINGLISGPATHMTYAVGNQVLALQKAVPETLVASAIGQARAAFGRQGERVRAGEAVAGLKSMVQSLPAATQAFLEAMRTGQTTLLPGEQGRPLQPFQGDTGLAVAKSITNDPVTWKEVGAQLYGMMQGARDAVVAGAALVRAGGEPGAPVVGFQYSPLGQIPDIAYRGVPVVPLGSAIRLPGRSVAAIHSFFRTANYLREGAAEGYRVAADKNLSGAAFAAEIANVRTNPSAEQMERWRTGATQATLMAEGGAFVKALSQLTNAKVNLPLLGDTAPLKFIDPFVHIGANVINQAIVQRTPVGLLSAEIRADLMGRNGNIAQDMAAARMLAGTALALVFGGLAMEGYASGSGPKEPAKQAMWRLGGYQPHSVRVGDMWYQVNRLGPIGMLIGIAADMYDVAHEASQGELLTAGAHLQHAITQNILDESFMRGPAELIRAIEDPGRYGEAYLRQFASSFVPFSVGMYQIARAADPYSRQARTVVDAMKQHIPGISETLMPKRDVWGEPLPNPEALGLPGMSAIWEKKISDDPVNKAMLDLGIAPARVERKIRNVDLTEQEYDDFARIAGRSAKMRLDVIVRSSDWQTWPGHVRHDVIAETIRQSREAARGLMMAKYPHIPADAVTEMRKRKLGEPTPLH